MLYAVPGKLVSNVFGDQHQQSKITETWFPALAMLTPFPNFYKMLTGH